MMNSTSVINETRHCCRAGTHWLLVTSQEVWHDLQYSSFWPFQNKRDAERPAVSSEAVVYLIGGGNGQPSLAGRVSFAERGSSIKESEASRLLPGFRAAYSRKIAATNASPHVAFREIVPYMTFIKNKNNWGLYLRRPIRQVPAEDFHRLVDELENQARRHPR